MKYLPLLLITLPLRTLAIPGISPRFSLGTVHSIPSGFVQSHADSASKAPIDTIYIRHGYFTGNALGHKNSSATLSRINSRISSHYSDLGLHDLAAAYDHTTGTTDLALAKRVSVTVGSVNVDINLLEVAAAAVLTAAVVCVFVPGCVAAVISEFAAAGVSSVSAGAEGLAIELTEAGALGGGRRLAKRQSTQYEGWACEYGGGDSYTSDFCTDGNYAPPILTAIGDYDTPGPDATSGNGQSAWQVMDNNGYGYYYGNELGLMWHCLSGGSTCGFDDYGPINIQYEPAPYATY